MTYKEFKQVYRWICKNCPDVTDIYADDLEQIICKAKVTRQIKSGSKWETKSKLIEDVSRIQYMNIVDAIPFFRGLGGKEYVTKCYTKHGLIPTKIISTSPDRVQRTIREFSF